VRLAGWQGPAQRLPVDRGIVDQAGRPEDVLRRGVAEVVARGVCVVAAVEIARESHRLLKHAAFAAANPRNPGPDAANGLGDDSNRRRPEPAAKCCGCEFHGAVRMAQLEGDS
jgi:hypothetical protein